MEKFVELNFQAFQEYHKSFSVNINFIYNYNMYNTSFIIIMAFLNYFKRKEPQFSREIFIGSNLWKFS